jgi:hypothetical protein
MRRSLPSPWAGSKAEIDFGAALGFVFAIMPPGRFMRFKRAAA